MPRTGRGPRRAPQALCHAPSASRVHAPVARCGLVQSDGSHRRVRARSTRARADKLSLGARGAAHDAPGSAAHDAWEQVGGSGTPRVLRAHPQRGRRALGGARGRRGRAARASTIAACPRAATPPAAT